MEQLCLIIIYLIYKIVGNNKDYNFKTLWTTLVNLKDRVSLKYIIMVFIDSKKYLKIRYIIDDICI